MFLYGNIEEINREQQNDRLRRVERDRLVREVEPANTRPGFWIRFHRTIHSAIKKMHPVAESAARSPDPRAHPRRGALPPRRPQAQPARQPRWQPGLDRS